MSLLLVIWCVVKCFALSCYVRRPEERDFLTVACWMVEIVLMAGVAILLEGRW
ncbi:MAG: hypothetical protein AB7S38_28905 [Vulcanimicrobiota bacterium]